MGPARDDLDERVIQAAAPDGEAVERMVRAALASVPAGTVASAVVEAPALSMWQWPAAFGVATACLIGLVTLGVWWCARVPPALAPVAAPNQVIRITADDGTTWILSTAPSDEWLPPGSGIVIGGGEGR